jgi:hypothetical protein
MLTLAVTSSGHIMFGIKWTGEWAGTKTLPEAVVKKIKCSAPTDN